jgi:hypothetical protein
MDDFFDPDISWQLRRVYIAAILERLLAATIASLPLIYPLLRTGFTKAISVFSHSTPSGNGLSKFGNSRNTSKRFAKHQASTNLTDRSSYGKHTRISSIDDQLHNSLGDSSVRYKGDRSEEILLSDGLQRPEPVLKANEEENIIVQTDIDVRSLHSLTGRDDTQVWPVSSLRPPIA